MHNRATRQIARYCGIKKLWEFTTVSIIASKLRAWRIELTQSLIPFKSHAISRYRESEADALLIFLAH